jgi:hypothetical protein
MEKIVIELEVKTKDSAIAVKELNKSFTDANKSTKNLSEELIEQKKILIELEKELHRVDVALKNTSKGNLSAQKSLSDQSTHLKDSIKDQKLALRELSLEKVESIKIDKETNLSSLESSKLLALLDNVTGGYTSKVIKLYKGFDAGIKSVKGFNIGLSSMKKALISTGIGALVVALGVIIAYWDDIVGFLDKSNIAIKKQEELTASLNKEIERTAFLRELDSNLINKQLKESLLRAKIAGKSENDIFKIKEKAQKDRIKLAEEEVKKADEILTKSSKSTKEDYKKAEKLQEEAYKRLGESRSELTLLGLEEELRVKNEFENKNKKEQKTDLKKDNKEDKEEQNRLNSINKIREEFKKKNENLEDETNLAKIKRQYDRDLKELEALDATELQKYELRKYYYGLIEQEQKFDEYEENEEIAAEDERLERLYENGQKEIANDKAVAEAKASIRQGNLNNVGAGFALLGQLAGRNKSLQAAALIGESAVGIAKTVINTQAANSAAVLKYALIPGGLALAAAEKSINNIGAGISIAANVSATAKGLSALGGGGSAPSRSSTGSVGTAPSIASIPPAFNVVGQSNTNQLADAIGGQSKQPVKAYVVSGDVTNAQEMDRNIIQGASI